ncbi:MAG: hypothetical protein N2C14_09530, partial [Planctomycetales bacterium]
MTRTANRKSARDERLDELLAETMDRVDAGEEIDERQLLADHPELADELQEFFEMGDLVARQAPSSLALSGGQKEKKMSPSKAELEAQLQQLAAAANALQAQLETIPEDAAPEPVETPAPVARSKRQKQPSAGSANTKPKQPSAAPITPKLPKGAKRDAAATTAAVAATTAAVATATATAAKKTNPKADPKSKKQASDKNQKSANGQDEQKAGRGLPFMASMFAWARRGGASATGVSTLMHAAVIVILALIAISGDKKDMNEVELLSELDAEDEEISEVIEDLEVELEEIDESMSSDIDSIVEAVKLDVGDPGSLDTTELEVGEVSTVEVGLGGLSGTELSREVGFGDGEGVGQTSFFGIPSSGKRFVYVIDNSKSMNGGKFEQAREELMRSVASLNHYQSFNVVLFSDKAYP